MKTKTRTPALLLALGLVVGVPACGGDAELCADVEALQADLDDLRAIEVEPGSLAELSSDLDEVEADVDQLLEDAASEYETEIDAVQSSPRDLRTSVAEAVQSPSGAAITQVSADLGEFSTAVGDLRDAVTDTC